MWSAISTSSVLADRSVSGTHRAASFPVDASTEPPWQILPARWPELGTLIDPHVGPSESYSKDHHSRGQKRHTLTLTHLSTKWNRIVGLPEVIRGFNGGGSRKLPDLIFPTI